MLRAGMPLVETRLRLSDGQIAGLVLTQRPVRALYGDKGGAWPMKLRVRLGYHDRDDVVLDARFEGMVADVPDAIGLPEPDYVWANEGDEGYGLFLPDARTFAWALVNVGNVTNPLLRALLWNAV
jgi:aminopeptidase N